MTENNEDTLDLRRIISKLGNLLVNIVGNFNFLNPFTKSHILKEVNFGDFRRFAKIFF